MADNSLKKGRYTKYSNKIGLFSNSKGSFIKNDTEVVLNFPFKDTVLEAGMSKEDKGREERFPKSSTMRSSKSYNVSSTLGNSIVRLTLSLILPLFYQLHAHHNQHLQFATCRLMRAKLIDKLPGILGKRPRQVKLRPF